MTSTTPHVAPQAQRAEAFHALHLADSPLLLANAWDVASAVVVAATGAPAVATTSAGVAWSLGVPDGNEISRETAVALVARVTAAVDVPVTAEIEGGLAPDPAGVGQTVQALLDAGAVGINLEDVSPAGDAQLREIEDQVQRIRAARAAADAAGIPLFINARIDTYLRSVGDSTTRMGATTERAAAYLEAGASGIFVPGVVDLPTVGELADAIAAPLNVLVGPGAPSVAELAAVGVRRISLGSSVAAAAYAVAERAARELAGPGTYESLRDELDYGRLNGLVSRG